MLRALLLMGLVACGRPALTFTPEKLPEAKVGEPYRAVIKTDGGETPLAGAKASNLPRGLSLVFLEHTDELIKIEGTPTAAGTTAVAIEAWCFGTNRAGQHGEHTYELVVR